MADYKTTLVVGADTSEAEREVERLKEKTKKLSDESSGGAQKPIPAAEKEGDAFGKAASRQIGKAVAGFAIHEIAGIGFAAARRPGENNVNVDRAEAAFSGAVQYGTVGAMIAGPIGAAVGALAGAATNLARHEIELAKNIRENQIARNDSVYNANVSSTVRASDSAFSELLRGRTRQERAEMLERRREEIRSGTGKWSIANLEASIRRREERGDIKSHEYKVESANLEMQRARAMALSDQIIATKMEKPPTYTAGDFADAYTKRGLFTGGDVASAAMSEQIAIGREQVQLLRRIAEMGTQEIYKTAAVERVATFGE